MACVFCLALFLVEFAYIFQQTPTLEVLNKAKEVIDYSALVARFQVLYYV